MLHRYCVESPFFLFCIGRPREAKRSPRKRSAWFHGDAPISCAYEEELLGTDEAGRQAIIAETKAKTGLPKVIKTGYHWLRLIHYFTCGADEAPAGHLLLIVREEAG